MKLKKAVKKFIQSIIKNQNFIQSKKYLRTGENEYCFLGLLCLAHSKKTKTKWNKTSSGYTYLGREAFIPKDVLNWSGITFSEAKKIAKMNDAGIDFLRILKCL